MFIKLLSERGGVIFTTHVLEEAEVLSDYIIILDNGKLMWAGTPRELFSDSIFEVIVPRRNFAKFEELVSAQQGKILADFGTYVLVKNTEAQSLEKLLQQNVILGFRKAGLRRWFNGSG